MAAWPAQVVGIQELTTNFVFILFFLVLIRKLYYYVYMKAREINIRKPILFTKARPHKIKAKVIHRKLKHKEQLV